MKCPKCHQVNTTGANFCHACGTPLNLPKKSFLARHKGTIITVVLVVAFVILPMSAFYNFINSIGKTDKEETVISGSGKDKIALVNVDGIIVETASQKGFNTISEGETSAREVKKILRKIEKDEKVKVLLLRVNSPGGSAVASEEIYRDLLSFKKKSGKKVVAYFSDTAASGAYYISMAADQIVTNPSTITGSIGVIISYLNFKDIAEKYGVKNIVYKSGAHKDIISEFRDPTDEEKAIIQSIIADTYDNFVEAVVTGRKLPEDQVPEYTAPNRR
ncbi:signal peptide peptidase SppA [Candidatus Microgenomates bacterium]|nr:signal peptide peptidase SppA [Candidatus Microgenomates bacterium]